MRSGEEGRGGVRRGEESEGSRCGAEAQPQTLIWLDASKPSSWLRSSSMVRCTCYAEGGGGEGHEGGEREKEEEEDTVIRQGSRVR